MIGGFKTVLVFLFLTAIVFVGVSYLRGMSFQEFGDAIRQIGSPKSPFSGSAFDSWWRARKAD
jgi:hypothetical protein